MVKKTGLDRIMPSFRITLCSGFVCGFIISVTLLLSGCSIPFNGEKLFIEEGCIQCHPFKGKGGMMGPDLSAVSNRRTDTWIDSYIQDPKKMYPFARMPSFSHLSSRKRSAIIAYLKQ